MVGEGKGGTMDDFYVWGLSNYVEADDTCSQVEDGEAIITILPRRCLPNCTQH